MNEVERDNVLEKQHFLSFIQTTAMKQQSEEERKYIVCMICARSDTAWHRTTLTKAERAPFKDMFPVRIQQFPTGERRIYTNLIGRQIPLSDASNYTILDWDKASKQVFPKFTQCFGMAVIV